MATAGILHVPLEATDIELGSAAWFDWLAADGHGSFHFVHPSGGFTARKERKQRGQSYWVAYRQVDHKLYKVYLGKSESLTEAHLCEASESLAVRARAAADDSGDGAKQPVRSGSEAT